MLKKKKKKIYELRVITKSAKSSYVKLFPSCFFVVFFFSKIFRHIHGSQSQLEAFRCAVRFLTKTLPRNISFSGLISNFDEHHRLWQTVELFLSVWSLVLWLDGQSDYIARVWAKTIILISLRFFWHLDQSSWSKMFSISLHY